MHPGLLAFASGGLLYIASAAVSAMQATGGAKASAWLAVAAVAFCHAALGCLVIGQRSDVTGSDRSPFLRVVASILMTALALATAMGVVVLFPLPVSPDMALILVTLSVVASAVALTLTAGRAWRRPDR
ncbi:MAG: hypothetical protein ACKVP3_05500 [Hyphomicrobiaceae bacterium]